MKEFVQRNLTVLSSTLNGFCDKTKGSHWSISKRNNLPAPMQWKIMAKIFREMSKNPFLRPTTIISPHCHDFTFLVACFCVLTPSGPDQLLSNEILSWNLPKSWRKTGIFGRAASVSNVILRVQWYLLRYRYSMASRFWHTNRRWKLFQQASKRTRKAWECMNWDCNSFHFSYFNNILSPNYSIIENCYHLRNSLVIKLLNFQTASIFSEKICVSLKAQLSKKI